MTTRFLDDAYTFYAVSTKFDTGVATDADAVLPYRVYEEETTTPILTGNMALLDSANTAGFYSEQITLSAANGFEVGKCYCVHIAGTVNSVVGAATREFVMRKKPLSPTTEGRELDVSAGGEAGIDWANIGSPTTAVNLSATNIDVDQVVASVSGTCATVTTLTNLPAITANWLTAAGIAAGALDGKGNWNIGKTGYSLTATTGLGNQTADITGSLSGSVGSVTGLTTATIADQVWDEILAGHLGVGSTGEALNAAGAAGDPWTTALPGAYGAGSAGFIIGTNIDAPIGTVDTVVDAIKAKTDSLTFTVANQVNANIKSVTDITVTGTGAAGNTWGP